MSIVGSQATLKNAVTKYFDSKIKKIKKESLAVKGTLSPDGKVLIGNKIYDAAVSVDLPMKLENQSVWCVTNRNDNTAVVIGK